jgi:hypothetical protein
MSEERHEEPTPAWVLKAENAMRRAGAEVVADHLRTGDPLVIGVDGKPVLVAAEDWIASLSQPPVAAG